MPELRRQLISNMSSLEFIEFEQNSRLKEARKIGVHSCESYKLRNLVDRIQDEYEGFLFCGAYGNDELYRLFLYESESPLGLIKLFQVGSHNAPIQESRHVEKVYTLMSAVYEKYPFAPCFVDSSGFECGFNERINADDARAISPYLFETGGYELMIDNDGEKFEGDPIAASLYEGQGFYLWWD